jgi:transcriptional regulator with XRE-family HTH domain
VTEPDPSDTPQETPRQAARAFVALDWLGLAQAVNAQMVERSVDHEELAEQAGVSITTLWEIRSGKSTIEFQPSTLRRLSSGLGLADNFFNKEFRKPIPYRSALADPSILVREVAAAIYPELTRIGERLDGIDRRLDQMHGAPSQLTVEVESPFPPTDRDTGE